MRRALHVVVPGPLEQRTGGYLYDARMVEGLRAAGWQVVVHNLDGLFDVGAPHARVSEGEKLGVQGLKGVEELLGRLGDGVGSLEVLNLLKGFEGVKELLGGIGDEVFVH